MLRSTTDSSGAYSFDNLLADEDFNGAGGGEPTFTVTVDNIGSSSISSMTYDVTVMDPLVTPELIFLDGFESGNTTRWSSTVGGP